MTIEKPHVRAFSLQERYEKYQRMFLWDKATMESVCTGLGREIRQGLRHNDQPMREEPSSLAMLDTCVSVSPTGNEVGVFYAVDFGGTNLRIVRVHLRHNQNPKVTQKSFNITEHTTTEQLPKGIMDAKATATMLFDVIAKCCHEFMSESGDLTNTQGEIYGCGFTFSFPMKQCAINSGVLTCWTKGFETGRDTDDRVEGQADVCQLLEAAFVRNDVPLSVRAALNDTTGTLLSAAYALRFRGDPDSPRQRLHVPPPCCIGLIVGTGMNACYIERSAKDFGYEGIIINTECGNYRNFLPRNIIDRQVDCASVNAGKQLTEKLCSGLYLPEICRRAILRVFRWEAPQLTWVHNSMTTAACCAAAYDTTPDLAAVRCMLERQLEWPSPSFETLKLVQGICHAVLKRSANMVACIVTAFGKQTGRLQYAAGGLSVGIDGSVYIKNAGYREDMQAALNHILQDQAKLIHLHQSLDGSGLGAAILAALEDSRISRKQSLLDF